MAARKSSSLLLNAGMIVGTVHSGGSLHAAARLRARELDLLELRVDSFAADPESLWQAARRLKVPLLITVRHPAEGGAHRLGTARRCELYRKFLPLAALIDIELRSAEKLADVISEARGAGARVVISIHDFRRTPPADRLQAWIRRAQQAGADICKIAAFVATAGDLCRLLALFARRQPLPLSVVGMGPLGKVSRLLFARLGSVLNYGYLDQPNASGQWEAHELKARVGELNARPPRAAAGSRA